MSNTSSIQAGRSSGKVHQITLTAILAAIIVIMSFTPLGYLNLGLVSITLLVIPVVIGGIVLGPVHGGILGAVFGATSFAKCFSEVFGGTLLSLNPVATFAACFIPRILIGVVAGALFPVLRKIDRTGVAAFIVTSLAGTLTNTVLFIGMVVAFFRNSYFEGSPFWTIFVGFFSVNVAVEIVVGVLVSAALSKVLLRFVPR